MMRPHASNILVIDDVAERQHDCDVVVDQVIYRQPEDYDGLVPPTAKLLIGTRYAILRPRFAELRIARRNKVRNSGLQKIFVAMGGTDPHGRLPAVLRGLDRLSLSANIQVIVVVAETRHLEELRGTIQNVRYPCDLRVDPSDIEDLMAECDLAVSAGGMTSYELACLEIPTLIVPATSLEARVAMALSARGGIVVVPSTPADLESQVSSGVKKLLAGSISRANTEVRDLELDGRGVSRVVRVMEQLRQWPDRATSLTNEGNELIP
jgi:spore coat polysaccharide biosynthesis predicted glycosyltransferase SpsG